MNDPTPTIGEDIGEVHNLGTEKDKRPVADVKKFVQEALTPDALRFAMSIMLSGPTIQAEFYNWMSDKWNALSQAARNEAALKAEERWFTVEAWERYSAAGGEDPSAPEKRTSTVNLKRVK